MTIIQGFGSTSCYIKIKVGGFVQMAFKAKRKITVTLCCLLAILMVAGCTAQTSSPSPSPAAQTSAAAASESTTAAPTPAPAASESATATPAATPVAKNATHQVLSIALWDINPDFVTSNDAIYMAIQNALNVEIAPIVITWDDYQTKVNVWAASGSLPDAFAVDEVGSSNYTKFIQNGLLKELPDDMSSYPSLVPLYNQSDVQATKYNGKFYMVPRANQAVNNSPTQPSTTQRTIWYRKDWAQQLGLKTPTTQTEFVAFVKALKDGMKADNGITAYDVTFIADCISLMSAPGITKDAWVKGDDGNYAPGFFTSAYLEQLKLMNQMYKDGLIDKDFPIEKTTDGLDKFATGKAAVCNYQCGTPRELIDTFATPYEKTFPGKKGVDAFGILPPMTASDGNAYVYNSSSFWSETYINAKVDADKADRILQLLDYCASPVFDQMCKYGIEGKDYTGSGDNVTITRPKDDKGNFVSISSLYKFRAGWSALTTWAIGRIPYSSDATFNDAEKQWYKGALAEMVKGKPGPYSYEASLSSTPLKDAFKWDISADVTKVITAKDPVAAYNTAISKYKAAGFDAMIKEVNDGLKAKGVN